MEENEQKQEAELHSEETEQKQDATDWKAEARKWEQRAKENRKAMEEALSAKEATTDASEQLKEALARAEKAEAEAAELTRQKEISEWKAEAARQTGIPADVLRGDTMEEITAHANAIKAALPAYRSLHDTGDHSAPPVTKEGILAIKNEKDRLAAIREHRELFK